MSNLVVLGVQWGDEGKGKLVDMLSSHFQLVVRFQGGANAGHTVVIDGAETVLHQVPSGILNPDAMCIIANGCVLDPDELNDEIQMLQNRGLRTHQRLRISSRCPLVMPYHRHLDAWFEARRAGNKIGTTGRGIGPAYVDKISRHGLRAGDFRQPELVREKLEEQLDYVNELAVKIFDTDPLNKQDIIDTFASYAETLGPYIADTGSILRNAEREGKRILFEGAQGTLLDIDHGTYPFVTSSNTTVGGVCTGTGLSPKSVHSVVGIVKAYCTRVGEGPFPTEDHGTGGEELRKAGGEFGATTGRPRRCGWFDAVAARYAAELNGLDGVFITKLDVLDDFDEILVCDEYEMNGDRIREFPDNLEMLAACKPVYTTMPGWRGETTASCTSMNCLPAKAQQYVDYLSKAMGVPVVGISTGQDRNHSIIGDLMRSFLENQRVE